jgi:hypothetical protein
VAQHLNATPNTEAITNILPNMQDLDDAITKPSAAPTPAFAEAAANELAGAGVAIARTNQLTDDQARILLPMMLRLTTHTLPQADEHDQREPVTGWSSAPRVTAAEAIIIHARHPFCYTNETREAILRLSIDPVPAVRLQIASHVTCLSHTAPDLLWNLLEYYAHHEPNPTVLAVTLRTLWHLPAIHAATTATLTGTIFERTIEGPDTEEVREACIRIFCSLCSGLTTPKARQSSITSSVIRSRTQTYCNALSSLSQNHCPQAINA